MLSPTARTLAVLRANGWTAEVVERFNSFTKQRTDFIGCVDIIAFHPVLGILGVQACTGTDHARRAAKVRAEPRAAVWLAAGGRLEVWSWSQRGKAGRRKLWTHREEPIKSGDAPPDAPADDVPPEPA